MEKSINASPLSDKDSGIKGFHAESALSFLGEGSKTASVSSDRLKTYSPLSFAYIGDAVYEVIIRTCMVAKYNTKADHYHRETIQYVNAAAQKRLMERMEPLLTADERKVYRRGCNARPATTAKNQSRHDYRIATGFETLIGYLYLSGEIERIFELVFSGLEDIAQT